MSEFQARDGSISGVHLQWVPGFDERRDENVADLQLRFETAGMDVRAYRDKLRQGILFTYRRLMHGAVDELLASGAEWVLSVQDDATPAANWAGELEAALANSPHPFVSLSHFSDRGLKLANRGFAYGEQVHGIWGQAVAYHRSIVEEYLQLVDWVFELDAEAYRKWDDGIASVFNLLHGTKSALTCRAVFTHLDVRSSVGNVPGRHRHPALTISEPAPPLPTWESRTVAHYPMTIDSRIHELVRIHKEQHAAADHHA